MAMGIESSSMEEGAEVLPARPVPPRQPPGLLTTLIKPQLLSNLVASYPAYWYEVRRCEFRVGVSRSGRGLLVNDPEAVRRILVTDAESFPKEENQLAILKPLLGKGLLTAEGEGWKQNRRLAAPIFQHSSVRDFAPLFVRAAERSALRAIERQSIYRIDQEMTKVTLEIIGEAVLSANLDENIDDISHTVTTILEKFPAMFLASAYLPAGLRNRFIGSIVQPGRKKLDVFARAIIEEARKDQDGKTLMHRLMAASRNEAGQEMGLDQVRDEVATFLLAGHETTATTLSWAWYLLTLYPEWQDRLYEEVRGVTGGRRLTADDVPSLPLTRAVIDETLRLYPVVANLLRRAAETVEIAPDIKVPKGDTVLISPWVLHRHRRYWREPERFDPMRFLGEEAAERPRQLYMPFGGGPRICIGMSFAIMEAVLILGTYVQRARIKVLNTDKVMPQARIVLRPNMPLEAIVSPRNIDAH
ncbi:cytochrome P450 [Parvibaculum sp.]|uniref:cytochrome P450 n=1 Tax=Parvibaculum sp. TaxID=2024848 RepID=UPI00391C16C1